jgi:signal transduction histidine kinase
MQASTWPLATLELRGEADVVVARQCARQVAALLGADGLHQTRVATAVSEIARNALVHAGGGRIELMLEAGHPRAHLLVRVSDQGPGIPGDAIPRDATAFGTGQSAGLIVARRLSESFEISSTASGSVVTLGTALPSDVVGSAAGAARVADALAKHPPGSLLEELHRQNQEMLRVLDSLLNRQEELLRLNEELAETNRGVLALHAELTRELDETNHGVLALYGELDDRTEELKRANKLKDQFISYLSHEFRTPVHSVIALAQLLLATGGSGLTADQQTQVHLIHNSSSGLLELIDDLLDIAKISAGRLSVRPEVFTAKELLGALRGMMRPLVSADVSLTFAEPDAIPPLYADQGKLSQILRNLISNALKFTTEGEVRVGARMRGADVVEFTVEDSGIGIAPEDQQRIFQDYQQVEGVFQRRAKGTGLGLPLSQRLAELLGGRITLESVPGVGSTFRVAIPVRYRGDVAPDATVRRATASASGEANILIVDDDAAARYVLRHLLESLGCQVTEAASGEEGLELARSQQPGAIFADLVMPGMDGFELLQRLRADPTTSGVPVIIRTGKRLSDEERTRLAARGADVLTKDEGSADRERAALRVGAALARIGIKFRRSEADRS